MKTFWVGMALTILYFLTLAITISSLNLQLMDSWNEFGDFLAGAFSPVAFLWLVLGFLQQQKELQQNTKALELQAEELKNSVNQYKEMVDVARQQLLADKDLSQKQAEIRELENRPDVSLTQTGWSERRGAFVKYEWILVNHGREARNILIQFSPALGNQEKLKIKKLTDERLKLPANEIRQSLLPGSISVTISYESIFGKQYVKVFELELANDYRFIITKESFM